ncbi:MAG: TetR/AcrR family transcriptional regulator [Polyangiaceae bacterium]|nr:TetR/AcrR family transcriptional regulator [Polyangiaceae bacterium]MCW5788981.1 TetR/AcrR family transcriptional regulator [Polyangiaceae bacterium]
MGPLQARYPGMEALLGRDTRGQLLRGAAQALASRGLRECSVEDILTASGFSRRTFYKLFRSKEDALEALFGGFTRLLVESVRLAVESQERPADRVIAAVDTFLELLELGGPLLLSLHAEAISRGSGLAAHREYVLRELTDLLSEQVRAHLGVRVDPYVYRCLLLGMEGLVLAAGSRGELTAEERGRVRAAVLPVLLRSLAPSGVSLARLPVVPDVPPGDEG